MNRFPLTIPVPSDFETLWRANMNLASLRSKFLLVLRSSCKHKSWTVFLVLGAGICGQKTFRLSFCRMGCREACFRWWDTGEIAALPPCTDSRGVLGTVALYTTRSSHTWKAPENSMGSIQYYCNKWKLCNLFPCLSLTACRSNKNTRPKHHFWFLFHEMWVSVKCCYKLWKVQ